MIDRIDLTDFRNHAALRLAASPGFVLLSGPNGAGKTNILEAVSLLAPGRGLRRARLSEIARRQGKGGFSVAVSLIDSTKIGTGTDALTPERRKLRINGSTAPIGELAERLAILWLTPAMDRLFAGAGSDRRRFLDRLVLALEPGHARHAARYEAAMRSRTKLLGQDQGPDLAWLASLEAAMADHGAELAQARMRTVEALGTAIDAADSAFPRAALALTGWSGADLRRQLESDRKRDAAAGRATTGPHRQDLAVAFADKGMPAALSSTGEQKALLLGLVLAHAELVAERRGQRPMLLLDEVAAHLDPGRRAQLFARLAGRGQVWMTATEAALFEGIGDAVRLELGA